MAQYKIMLRDLTSAHEFTQVVSATSQGAALCAALGGYHWPYTRANIRHATRMAGVYDRKPPDQRYQLLNIERVDELIARPRRLRRIRIPDGPAGDMDRFLLERNENE